MKANKTIRWKVIDNHIRNSCFANGIYEIFYERNRIIKAPSESLGIFCFERKKNAKNFINIMMIDSFKIIKVKTYGKGKRPKQICDSYWDSLLSLWYKGKLLTLNSCLPPEGTICYPAVMPLE